MFRTKLVIVLFILLLNYNIYGFIISTRIICNYRNIILNNNKINVLNIKNEEYLLLFFKTFVNILYLHIILFNIFYIIYVINI